MADYQRPRIGAGALFGRQSRDGVHVHRALVEVNFFPRPRH
jgi:hypothetical protein